MGHDHKRPTRPATKKKAPGPSEAPAGRRSGKGRHGVASHRQIERYQALLANIPDVTWTSDAQGNIVFVSPNIEQMYGFTPEEVCQGGRAVWLKRIHPDDVAQVKQAFQSFFTHGRRLDVEYRAQRKDGRWIWVHERAVATYEEDGVTFADGILTDITEPRQPLDTLQLTQERLRHLFLSSPAVIYSCQPSGNCAPTYVSPNITSQLGYEIDEFLGDPDFWVSRIHPDDVSLILDGLSSLFKHEHHTHEYRFLHKDGNYRWMRDEMRLVRDSDENPQEIVGCWIDITDHRQAEVALRESEERYRAVFEQAGDSIVMTDADTGEITEFNQRAHQNLGYTREEFSKLKLTDLDVLESTEDVAKHVEKIAKEGLDTFLTKHQTKEGQIREVLVFSKFLITSKRRLISSIWHDITEQKQAEEALRTAYQEKAAVLDSMSELVIYQDMEHRVMWANKAAGESVGLAPEELAGRYCYEVWHQRTKPCEGCPVSRAHKTGQTEQGEMTTPGGRTGFIRAHPICNTEGQPVSVVEVVDDITERKSLEYVLRIKDRAIESSTSAVAFTDLDGRITYVNEAFLQLWGYEHKEEVIGEPTTGFWQSKDSAEHVAELLGVKSRWQGELVAKKKDGTLADVQISASLVKDSNGVPLCMMGTFYDVTERNRAEQQLRIKTEELEAIADTMTLFVDTGDWQQASCVLLRCALNQTESELGFLGTVQDKQTLRIHAFEGMVRQDETVPGQYERALRAYQEAGYLELTNLQTLFGEALTSRRAVLSNDPNSDPRAGGVPPGHPPLRRFLGVPILYGQDVVGLIAVANAARPYEAQDVSAVETLADAVGVLLDSSLRQEREAHLQRQLQHTERLASIGTLAAGIAHEINNPVGSVLVAAQYALLCRHERDAEQATQTALEDIIENSRRTARIIRSLLQFARQEPTEKWPCDLNDAVRRAIDLTQTEARKHGATIEAKLATGLPEVTMNPTAIQQVFVNIIRNAFQAGGSGTCITIRTEHCCGMVRTSVDDDGPGITEERREHVFDPFYTTRHADGGTGLGLSMSHGIICEHGGKIDVVSQGGRGATVIIDLPLEPNT